MKITNNRSTAAIFMYKWSNTTQKEKFAAYEKRTLPNLTHADQVLSRQYIVNRTTSGTGTTESNFIEVTTPGLANNHVVNSLKEVGRQTNGTWEIEA